MNIIALKLISGEDILCNLLLEDAETYRVENPAAIITQPTADGRGVNIGLAPYLPYSKDKNIRIFRHACAAAFEPDIQLVNEYNRIFGTIQIATAFDMSKILGAK